MATKKIILITGATAGIGRATALYLARKGHRVFATGRRAHVLEAIEKEARSAGITTLETLVLDVTKPESIAAAKAEIAKRTDGYGIDALVNNAGFGTVGPLEEISDESLRAQYETNVFGLMAMTRAFVPQMRERGDGRVVNVSSVGGKLTFPMMGAYNSTKYAVESLSDALRVELRPFGVKVVVIEPGSIATEFAEVAMGTIPEANRSPYAGAIADADAMRAKFDGTAVGPEHIARAIETAVTSRSPSARYVRPWRTYALLALFSWLPTSLMDAILAQMTGLTKKKLAPALRAASAAG